MNEEERLNDPTEISDHPFTHTLQCKKALLTVDQQRVNEAIKFDCGLFDPFIDTRTPFWLVTSQCKISNNCYIFLFFSIPCLILFRTLIKTPYFTRFLDLMTT